MFAKKDKTKLACMDAVMAYKKISSMGPEIICALSGFLYATESDKVARLTGALMPILYKAAERAADTLDSMPKRGDGEVV